MQPVRWGVIGCGQISFDRAMPAITKAYNAELVAVADIQEERLALARETFPDITAYADYKTLLSDGNVDAVYIGLPNELHCGITLDAAEQGKHVLCEKPLAIDAAEARTMIDACRRNNVKLMAAYMSRFSDVFQEARRIIASERLGPIGMVNANFSFAAWQGYTLDKPGAWRWTGKRGGPLLDAGIYLAFAIRELTGNRIVRVSADMRSVIAKEMPAEDTVVAWFELENGTSGILTTTYTLVDSYFAVRGRDGWLTLEQAFAQRPTGRLVCRAGSYQLDYATDINRIDHFDNYRREIEHFCEAILHECAYRPSPQEALDDMTCLDAIEESARSGQIVTLHYDNLTT